MDTFPPPCAGLLLRLGGAKRRARRSNGKEQHGEGGAVLQAVNQYAHKQQLPKTGGFGGDPIPGVGSPPEAKQPAPPVVTT